ncbi:MAG: methyltransferase domain-containing protein [Erysipelotrichaceae bacterium]
MFVCPKCKALLVKQNNQFICSHHHTYDVAKSGYVNLVLGNTQQSGDDKEMVKCRSDFLNKNYYHILRDELIKIVKQYPHQVMVDAGCGEGYYTSHISDAYPRATMYGFDLSKAALTHASKQNKQVQYAIASLFHLPLQDQSVDLIFNVFAPCAMDEFNRLLKTDGILIQVTPAPRHLIQLKHILYDQIYENDGETKDYEGFIKEEIIIKDQIHLSTKEDINHLFSMTPYSWKTTKKDKDKLMNYETLDTEISFILSIYRKKTK